MVAAALDGGATLYSCVEKELPLPLCWKPARALAKLCHARQAVPFVVDEWEVALAASADGVACAADMAPPVDLRAPLGPDVLLVFLAHNAALRPGDYRWWCGSFVTGTVRCPPGDGRDDACRDGGGEHSGGGHEGRY